MGYGKQYGGWFEIPVNDMERAKNFYESVFKISIPFMIWMDLLWAGFLQHQVKQVLWGP
ncbi:VOC family protein [Arenibacter arenosicollis]|uniref:VOC family protein n=1 Tax=Arenibacter arenosicollis TaxID=2762274 RepID=UPI003CCDC034